MRGRRTDNPLLSQQAFAELYESGIEVREQVGMVFTARNGRIVRHEEYLEWNQALEAVGLQHECNVSPEPRWVLLRRRTGDPLPQRLGLI